ncbi:MAG: MOSC domain-containing protein [Candidatus Omnitrophica bacterium]|nr:MOSC domain-containing protein [Candidatus Omnitrophota bacterium]
MLPRIVSINVSRGGIPKLPVPKIRLTAAGLEGDGHNHAKHDSPIQAVCIQDVEKLNELSRNGYSLSPGKAGENLTVEDLHVNSLPIGTRLEFSAGVILEITKVRKPCYVMDAIDPRLKDDAVGRHGMYAKVIKEGFISIGEAIQVLKPTVPYPSTWI